MNVIVESEYAESMLRVFKYHPHFTMSDSDREGLLEKKKEDLVDYVLALRSDDTDLNKKLDRANNYIDMYKEKIKELQAEINSGAQQRVKYKALTKVNEDLQQENGKLAEKIVELEALNETMGDELPNLHNKLERTEKSLEDQIKNGANTQQALDEVRAQRRAELDECGKNKKTIRDAMNNTIEELRERVEGLKKDDMQKEEVISKLSGNIQRLENTNLALKQLEMDQSKAIMAQRTADDLHAQQNRQIQKTLQDQLDMEKATTKLLRERVESTEQSLEKFTKMAKPSDKPRPKSPVGQTKAQEEEGKKPCTFAKIGGKCPSGRKSPLNPNQLARKIKYRF